MWVDLEPKYFDGVANGELLVFDNGEVGPIGFFKFENN